MWHEAMELVGVGILFRGYQRRLLVKEEEELEELEQEKEVLEELEEEDILWGGLGHNLPGQS